MRRKVDYKRALIIVANEELLPLEKTMTVQDLALEEPHGLGVRTFSERNQLGISAASLGLDEGEYPGYEWPLALASLGHAVICCDEEIIICLPEKLSQNQIQWFQEYKWFFLERKRHLSYMVVSLNKEIVDFKDSLGYKGVFDYLYYHIDSLEQTENQSEGMKR